MHIAITCNGRLCSQRATLKHHKNQSFINYRAPSTLNRYSFWFPLLGVENSHSRVLHCKLNLISFHDSGAEWKLSRGFGMWCEWIIWRILPLRTELLNNWICCKFSSFSSIPLPLYNVASRTRLLSALILIFLIQFQYLLEMFSVNIYWLGVGWEILFSDTFEFIAIAIWIQIIIKGCCLIAPREIALLSFQLAQ